MQRPNHPSPEDESEAVLIQVNRACNRFERRWQTGERPTIAEMLEGSDPSLRNAMIRELLPLDVEYRRRAGIPLDLQEYRSAYPDIDADWLARIVNPQQESPDDHTEHVSPAVSGTFNTSKPLITPNLGRVDQEGGSPQGKEQTKHAEPNLPERVGRYSIRERVGSGGFGIVYRAHDDELQRDVAIKIPYRDSLSTSEAANTFLNEARTVAGLDHRFIVPIYDFGRTDDGTCYLVTKFIDGTELTTKMNEGNWSHEEIARLTSCIAEGLHNAHQHGVTHRDVKPANILLDRFGTPYLTDFGLALRDADTACHLRLVGTPSYMSPEQARGESHRVDGRTDIFSLGVVLYEMLSGRKPFPGDSADEVLDLVKNFEPRPPRQWDDRIPRELERICLKMLCKRVSDRYSTAADLAEDLERFQRQTKHTTTVNSSWATSTADSPGTYGCSPCKIDRKNSGDRAEGFAFL